MKNLIFKNMFFVVSMEENLCCRFYLWNKNDWNNLKRGMNMKNKLIRLTSVLLSAMIMATGFTACDTANDKKVTIVNVSYDPTR